VYRIQLGRVCGERLQLYPWDPLQIILYHPARMNNDLVPYDDHRTGNRAAELLKECDDGGAAEVAIVLQTVMMPTELIPAGADCDGPDGGDTPVRVRHFVD